MENAKQKAIEVAYGELYQECIDENGWFRHSVKTPKTLLEHHLKNKDFYESKLLNKPDSFELYIRLKSLAGIETNNNWVSINSEDDLPKESIECFLILSQDIIESKEIFLGSFDKDYGLFFKDDGNNLGYNELEITHYQKIIKPEKPIY